MRRIGSWILLCALLCGALSGCSSGSKTLRRATYLDLFDTVTVISGYAESEAEFQKTAAHIHDQLLEYHELFDIYHAYSGVNNLYTVNEAAGGAAVSVDPRLPQLLNFCRDMCTRTDGLVNAAMGSVLRLWHDAREAGLDNPEEAALPGDAALRQAAQHTSWDAVLLDMAAGTVQITDPQLRLDVGAIAKGYAVEQVVQTLAAEGLTGYLLSVGGNVRAIGGKPGGENWIVGLENPDGGALTGRLAVQDCSVVTSGAYQRYYTVDGQQYCHIISPETLYPPTYYQSVTIVGSDSGVCDALSTALFCLPRSAALQLLEAFPGYEAFFLCADGDTAETPGFQALRVPEENGRNS